MLKSVTALESDARFNPQVWAERIGEWVKEHKPVRIMFIAEMPDGEIKIAGSGPGMDNILYLIGLLTIAGNRLTLLGVEDES